MKVQMEAFTGMVIGEFEATKVKIEGNDGLEIVLKDGRKMAFDADTLKQVNAAKPQYANRIRIMVQFPTTMKEMNKHQKLAAQQVKHAINWIVGGYENSIQDGHMDASEMPSKEELVDEIYNELMVSSYGPGSCSCHPIEEIKFAGMDFIKFYTNYRLTKEGY